MSNPYAANIAPLPVGAHYFPIDNGRYDVKANLFRPGQDFGNGGANQKVLKIDSAASAYRQQKFRSRNEDIGQYYCEELLTDNRTNCFLNRFLVELLCTEHPQYFSLNSIDDGWLLRCELTQETLAFDTNNEFDLNAATIVFPIKTESMLWSVSFRKICVC